MNRPAFQKLYWGFLFVLLDFRIQGFDILPDIVGYYLFYTGMVMLISESEHFSKGSKYAIFMMILSVFAIYEPPMGTGQVAILSVSWNNPLMLIPIALSLILGLITGYHLFSGVREMAAAREALEIEMEASTRWKQFLILNLAVPVSLILIMVPILFFVAMLVLFVAMVFYTVSVMQFMRRCGENLQDSLPAAEDVDAVY